MNWIKRIFCSQEEFVAHIVDPITRKDSFEVKHCKPEKDISEPVLSFVKCVRDNPKRFDVEELEGKYYTYTSTEFNDSRKAYKLWDKVVKKGWVLKGVQYIDYWTVWQVEYLPGAKYFSDPFFLTEDEKSYIIKEVKEIMEYRKGRKVALNNIRKQRRIRDERNRLKEIYK